MSNAIKNIRLADGSIMKFEQVEATQSTAAIAKARALAGANNMHVVFTNRRGDIDKSQSSDRGVYLSCILRPSFFPSQAGLLAPLATVALVTALEQHTTKKLGIGWLSDIFCDGYKIGNVSIEGKLNSFSSYEYLIVSFSVKMDDKNFPPRLGDMVRKVFESDNDSIEMIIATTILKKFSTIYTSIKSPQKYMDIYVEKFVLLNKRIKYIKDGKKKNCRVVGIDKATCALTVEVSRGEEITIYSPSGVCVPNRIRAV